MNEDTEKQITVPQEGRASEAIQQEGKFTNTAKQNTWTEATADNRKSKKDTVSQEGLTDDKIAEIKAKGGFKKFELFDSAQDTSEEFLIAENKDGKDFIKKIEAQKDPERTVPPENTLLLLKDFFHKYTTPFVDAYWRTKALKDGDQKKCNLYEEIVERFERSPWKKPDDLKIKLDRSITYPHYDSQKSTLFMDPVEHPAKQIEHLAHEGFHATHQATEQLYMGQKELSLDEFVRIKSELETESFVVEIKVHNQLTASMHGGPVTYKWANSKREPQPDKDLGALYAEEGRAGLKKFIIDNAYTEMDIGGKKKMATYHDYYVDQYISYKANWKKAHDDLQARFKADPSLKQAILKEHF